MSRQIIDVPADSHLFAGSRESFTRNGYAPAVRAGGLLFISGQIARQPDGTIPTDIAEQCDLVFQRTIEVLKWNGLTLDDLVEMISYHVDLRENMAHFTAAKEKYIKAPFVAWTAVGVAALGNPADMIELRSVAALRDGVEL